MRPFPTETNAIYRIYQIKYRLSRQTDYVEIFHHNHVALTYLSKVITVREEITQQRLVEFITT